MMRTILIGAACLSATAAVAADENAARGAIKAVFAQIDACVAKSDSKCLSALFADDATFAGPVEGGKIVSGKAGISQFFDGMMKGSGVKQQRSVEQVRFIGDDRAFVDCSVKSMVAHEGGAIEEDWHTAALMRLENGKWLLEDVRFYIVDTGQRQPPTPCPKPVTPCPTHPPTTDTGDPKVPPPPDGPAEPVDPAQS